MTALFKWLACQKLAAYGKSPYSRNNPGNALGTEMMIAYPEPGSVYNSETLARSRKRPSLPGHEIQAHDGVGIRELPNIITYK